jgi:hypothetical protein
MNLFYKLDPVTHEISPCDVRVLEREIDTRVAFERVREGVEVSTVFLGVDHNFFGVGGPILFETMIFGGDLRISKKSSNASRRATTSRLRNEHIVSRRKCYAHSRKSRRDESS